MKRKMILRLSFLAVLLTLLWSCQQELLQTEQDAELQSRKLNVQRLNHEQLQQKHGSTLEKINSLVPKKLSGRTYTDTENGFSVDTGKALLIEDDKGNKSYTFEINRSQPNTGLYENLVLKDMGNDTYSAFMMQYKKTLFQLPDTPSDDNLNNYISIQDLGIKNGSDIFGKTMICYKTFGNNTYVPGTPCVNGHTDPAVCDLTGSAAPVPGYWVTGYDVMPYLCDNEPNPFSTVPLEGGGGGGTSGGTNPCTFLKSVLGKKFVDPPNATIKDATTLLDQHLPATNPHNDGTKELTILASIIANSNDVQLGQFQSNGSETGEVTNSIPPAVKYVFIGHDHPGNSDLSTFSLSDLYYVYTLIKSGNVDNNTLFYVTTAHGTKYAFRITDLISFESWAAGFFMGWEAELLLLQNMQKPRIDSSENDYDDYVDKTYTIIDNERGFLKFFNENMLFLEMYKLENTNWNKISYNSISDNVKKTPCN